MPSNNKARISGLAASAHALRSNFTRSPFHLAVGDLGSRLDVHLQIVPESSNFSRDEVEGNIRTRGKT